VVSPVTMETGNKVAMNRPPNVSDLEESEYFYPARGVKCQTNINIRFIRFIIKEYKYIYIWQKINLRKHRTE